MRKRASPQAYLPGQPIAPAIRSGACRCKQADDCRGTVAGYPQTQICRPCNDWIAGQGSEPHAAAGRRVILGGGADNFGARLVTSPDSRAFSDTALSVGAGR